MKTSKEIKDKLIIPGGVDIRFGGDSCEGCIFDVSKDRNYNGTCSFKIEKSVDDEIERMKKERAKKRLESYLDGCKKNNKKEDSEKIEKIKESWKSDIIEKSPRCNRGDSPFRKPFIFVRW